MRTCQVDLGDRSYAIRIGRDLDPACFAEHLPPGGAVCIVDAKVSSLHGDRLDRLFPGLTRLDLPAGEASKHLGQLERLAGCLLDLDCGRDTLLFAVGGGVTGDLAGFLAASFMRGIPFVQVPTTLLAQVDASVGGKVAVNLPGVKNILGAFHQPRAVLADLMWLETLPGRELAAGLAEVIKMAVCLDAAFFDSLETSGDRLLDPGCPELEAVIARSCEIKRDVVEEDEREQGPRQILNFGHTLAHAIEGAASATPYLHGEAVGVGMLAALRLGERLGMGGPVMIERLRELLFRLGLPCRLPPDANPAALIEIMAGDKKRREASLRFVILEDWGRARYGIPVDATLLEEILEEFLPD